MSLTGAKIGGRFHGPSDGLGAPTRVGGLAHREAMAGPIYGGTVMSRSHICYGLATLPIGLPAIGVSGRGLDCVLWGLICFG